jgi:hypothetical protein
MNKLLAAAVVWTLMCGSALAVNNAPASDASIRELLELTNAQQMIAGMKGQMTTMMNAASQNATRGQTVTPERQAILDRMADKMSGVVTDMLNWDVLLPIYLRTYRDSFTQDEINGAIKFYKSAAGQAYVKKMPLAMQNVMREMQDFINPFKKKCWPSRRSPFKSSKI